MFARVTVSADTNVKVEGASRPILVHRDQGGHSDPAFLKHLEDRAVEFQESVKTATRLSTASEPASQSRSRSGVKISFICLEITKKSFQASRLTIKLQLNFYNQCVKRAIFCILIKISQGKSGKYSELEFSFIFKQA